MNKYLLTLGVLCAINVSKAQDVIVKKDGSTVVSKVLEVNQDDIKYKKYSNLDGPTYTIYKKEITAPMGCLLIIPLPEAVIIQLPI